MKKQIFLFTLLILYYLPLTTFLQPVWADDVTISKNFTVSAIVPAKATDYQIQLNGPSEDIFRQDSMLGYQIIYGSQLNYPSNITIEASWNGENQGVVDYVYSSATPAINGIQPVVDLANQKIIWNINNIPGQNLNNTLYFALKTNHLYSGSSSVDFTVTAHLVGPGLITPDIIRVKTYKYNYNPPSSQTSQTYTPPQTYQAPTTTKPQFKPPAATVFNNIFLSSISESDAKILVELRDKYFPSISFGTKANLLNNKISSLSSGKLQEMTLDKLEPETQYYFKVEAKDDKGKVVGTETFIFKTAAVSDKPDIEQDSLIVSSSNSILSSPQSGSQPQTAEEVKNKLKERNTIVVPEQTSYEIRFRLKRSSSIKQIKAVLKAKNVLGISSVFAQEASDKTVDLEEVEPGVFVGRLKSPPESGNYEIIARITDDKGNIVEKKVADVKVLKKMTLIDSASKNPIEGARVLLYVYNPQSRTFQKVSPISTAIKNPSFSNNKGEMDLVLPNGRYKTELANLGYKDKEVEFTIGVKDEDGFPQVILEKGPFNPLTVLKYHWNTVLDVVDNTKGYILNLSNSIRFFELNAMIAILVLIFLSLLSLSSRLHVPLHSIPEYLQHLTKIHVLQRKFSEKVKGRVFDETSGQGLKGADVFLIDSDKNKIVSTATTSSQGDFSFLKLSAKSYEIEVMKDGFEPILFHESEIQSVGLGGYLLNIKKRDLGLTIREKIRIYLTQILSLFFEGLILLSLVFEIALGFSLGWLKALPFICFSLISFILWLIHLSHLRSERNIF